jgi:hypothetical protein
MGRYEIYGEETVILVLHEYMTTPEEVLALFDTRVKYL